MVRRKDLLAWAIGIAWLCLFGGSLALIRHFDAPGAREESREEASIWLCGGRYAMAHNRGDSMRVSLHLPGSDGANDLTCGTLQRMFPGQVQDASRAWAKAAWR